MHKDLQSSVAVIGKAILKFNETTIIDNKNLLKMLFT